VAGPKPGAAKSPLKFFSPLLEKSVGHSLKLFDNIKKNLTPLRKLFALPGIPSWLRAYLVASMIEASQPMERRLPYKLKPI